MKHTLESLRYIDYPIIQLMGDAESLLGDCSTLSHHDSTLYRSAVSALFAGIEGSVFVLKQVFKDIPEFNTKLTQNELFILSDKKPVLKDNGKASHEAAFLRLAPNVKFLEMISKRLLKTTSDLAHSKHWGTFLEGIQVRNRITHPKTMNDMIVTDKELNMMFNIFEMFVDFFSAIIQVLKSRTTGSTRPGGTRPS
ncbi:MAG: hypothetical protein PVG39_22150 [Desulfobacteraceae bacterium]